MSQKIARITAVLPSILMLAGTFALLTLAITYHSIFNMLILSQYHMVATLLPMATYLPFFLRRYVKGKLKIKMNV